MASSLVRHRRAILGSAFLLLAPACGTSPDGQDTASSTAAPSDTASSAEPDATTGTADQNTGSSSSTQETTGDTPTDIPDAPELKEIKSIVERDSDPQVVDADRITLRDGNIDLSFELLALSGKKANENVAVSAVSLRSAFGMVHAMAKGKTQTEIADTMNFLSDAQKTQAGLNHIDQTLISRNLDASKQEGELLLSSANRMFISGELAPSDAFLDELAKNYGAGVYELDFAKDPEAARSKINTWVASQTFARIPELFPPDSIKGNTQWVLSNALYFRGTWSVAMGKAQPKPFTLEDKTTIEVATISSARYSARYGTGKDLSWIEVPLRGGKLKAIVLVPDAGKFGEVESSMSAATLNALMKDHSSGEVQVQVPTFKVKTGSMDLSSALKAKMPKVFSEADFSGFGYPNPIPVTSVYQSVFLAASRDGVEAAAATGVGADKSDSKPDFSLVADRPFLFLVYDQPSGLVLFVGRVMDPRSE